MSGEGQVLLVDCGATSLVALRAQGLDPGAVDAVAVTHLHGDHFGGLPFLILDGQFSRRSAPLQVAGPPGIRARLAEAMEALFPGSRRRGAGSLRRSPSCAPTGRHLQRARRRCAAGKPGTPAARRRWCCEWNRAARASPIPGTRSGLRRWPGPRTGRTCPRRRPARSTGRSGTTWIIQTLRAHPGEIGARRIVLTHMSAAMLTRLADAGLPAAYDGMTADR